MASPRERLGATGKPLTSVVTVGIGGSFLGPLFVHTSLRTSPEAAEEARGRQLRFLANVDPVDVARSLNGLDPETTLVVVVSKTFTTAETMLNARTVRQWIIASLGKDRRVVQSRLFHSSARFFKALNCGITRVVRTVTAIGGDGRLRNGV